MKIFDSHFHIIDHSFPLQTNHGYLPEYFSVADYKAIMQRYELVGGVVVAGSFQGTDTTFLKAALKKLGPAYVGIAQLPGTITEEEVLELNTAGIRGIRFNLFRNNGAVPFSTELALKVHDIAQWHTEVYIDSKYLDDFSDSLIRLPKVCIDHLGISKAGLRSLLRLAEQGVHIKASGFGRIDFDVASALTAIQSANPNSLMFGSDLPSTRAPRAFSHRDVDLIKRALTETDTERIFCNNARVFYRVNEQ